MEFIGGINPILEDVKKEDTRIQKIYLARRREDQAIRLIRKLARQRRIPISFKEKSDLDHMAGGVLHQGALALVTPVRFVELEELLRADRTNEEKALLLLLDHIVDPQNLGALIRSAEAAGAHGVVMEQRRSSPVTPVVVKASAGAVEHVSLAQVSNLAQAMDVLKEHGFWIMGADGAAERSLYEMDFRDHVALVIGNEGKGLRPLIKRKCDLLFRIPMHGKISSLNAAAAGAVALFEVVRQRTMIISAGTGSS
jgi:23S rRNA (guanosine2251-2'-O)-methyltransferase